MVLGSAKFLGLRTKVLPGISSLDTLFVDLGFDPCTQGVQMYEATDLLLRRRPIQPDVPCFIWQIGAIGSRLYSEALSTAARFSHIRDYLLQFYPLVPSTITEFTLDTIEDKAAELHQGVTVFIPPMKIREVQDCALLQSMDEVEYLRELTIKPTTA
jgi:hypothetical protein